MTNETKQEEAGAQSSATPAIWSRLFDMYKQVEFRPAPAYKALSDAPSGTVDNLVEIPDGQNTIFEDKERLAYFFDFSGKDLAVLAALGYNERMQALGIKTALSEGPEWGKPVNVFAQRFVKTPVVKKLEALAAEGKRVTHVMLASETYEGDTHYGTRRSHDEAVIYEVEPTAAWKEEMTKEAKLIVVSGPSGVGKGPIIKELMTCGGPPIAQVQVKKAWSPRQGGVPSGTDLKGVGVYHEFDCRGVKQRIYWDELGLALRKDSHVLIEGYHTQRDTLCGWARRFGTKVQPVSVFVSPLSPEMIRGEAGKGRGIEDYLPHIMCNALTKRAFSEHKEFTVDLLTELLARARGSVNELASARKYDWVIVNTCYEGDKGWTSNPLANNALRAVTALYDIVYNGECQDTQHAMTGAEFEARCR